TTETTLLLAPLPLPSVPLLIRGLLPPVGLPDGDGGGDQHPAAIVGTVFGDTNADGVRDLNEPGAPRRTVVLELADKGPVRTTVTAALGQYVFAGLAPGSYRVRVMLTEDELETTSSDWSIPLQPGERAVAPDIGIIDRAGRNAPGREGADKAAPNRTAPDGG